MELTEDQVSEFIKDGKWVIRTWDEGCGYCVKYEPIFNEYESESNIAYAKGGSNVSVSFGKLRLHVLKDQKPSAFKRAYMKQDTTDNIKETVPGTFVFENGELKARHFGAMTKEQLKDLVENYKAPVQVQQPQQIPSIEEICKTATTDKLKVFMFDNNENLKLLNRHQELIYVEILKRQQPQKAQ